MPDEHTLADNEPHPAAQDALEWLKLYQIEHFEEWQMMKEAIYSTSLSGNRLAQIIGSTLNRLEAGEPVSDRYLLGLCWFIRQSLLETNIKVDGEKH